MCDLLEMSFGKIWRLIPLSDLAKHSRTARADECAADNRTVYIGSLGKNEPKRGAQLVLKVRAILMLLHTLLS